MSIADKLITIAENEVKVYDAGKRAERDRFWDSIQQNGTRTNYNRAFFSWKEADFNPKHPIVSGNGATDLQETVAYGTVEDTKVPIISTSSNNYLNATFSTNTKLHTIRKLQVVEGTTYYATFYNCTALKNLTMAGTIGQSGINVSYCTLLTHDSLMSIINTLKDYSGNGSTHTVTLGATNLGKLTDAEKAMATQKGWSLA